MNVALFVCAVRFLTVVLAAPESPRSPAHVMVAGLDGKTVDGIGAPLPAANVVFVDSLGTTFASARSDSVGHFELFHDITLPVGSYHIEGTAGRYAGSALLRVEPSDEGALFTVDLPVAQDTDLVARGELPTPVRRACVSLNLLFGTNRSPGSADAQGPRFTNDRAPLSVGSCIVSVPRDHRKGKLEGPFLGLSFLSDTLRHVLLRSVTLQDSSAFLTELRRRASTSDAHDLLLFVHGFNTDFDEAARRCGQIAYDLSWRGPSVFFSWASAASLTAYMADEATADVSAVALARYLILIGGDRSVTHVDIVCHSMGSRVVLSALDQLRSDNPSVLAKIKNVVLAAPDMDADAFRQVASRLQSRVGRITLYASSRDAALSLSQSLHACPRAGESGNGLVLVKGSDTIDASAVDTGLVGHSYYGDNRTLLSDMFNLLVRNTPPDDRFGLTRQTNSPVPYWVFAP